jgi:polyisoprenoid-binding protein YceI
VLDPEQHSGSIDFVVDVTSIDTGWNARDEFLRG